MSSGGLIALVLRKTLLEWSTMPKRPSVFINQSMLTTGFDDRHPIYGGTAAGTGVGTVSGVVKLGALPAKRRVRLYEASTGVLIREQWAGADGSYRFEGLRKDYKYTVTAVDYSGVYNDVIKANITPI